MVSIYNPVEVKERLSNMESDFGVLSSVELKSSSLALFISLTNFFINICFRGLFVLQLLRFLLGFPRLKVKTFFPLAFEVDLALRSGKSDTGLCTSGEKLDLQASLLEVNFHRTLGCPTQLSLSDTSHYVFLAKGFLYIVRGEKNQNYVDGFTIAFHL